SDYVEVPFHVSLDLPTEWTIEFWLKPRRVVAHRPQFLVSRWGGPAGYAIWLDNSRFEVAVDDGTTEVYLRSSRLVVTGLWQHFAVTSDGQALRLYIDGDLDNEMQASVGAIQALSPMNFGRTPLNTYDGLMDEIRIWHTKRTSSQIIAAMHQGLSGTEPGLAGYWRFDVGHGDVAFDGSPNDNVGRLGEKVGPDDLDPSWSFDVPLVDAWRSATSW
ncbi:MAG: LamG domain-containing protein, partial [Gemmatimonadales bacterium]